jgi:hypothetical protein
MAVDTIVRARMRNGYRTTQQLLARAELDSDPVSVFVDGSSWEDAERAIFIVKGRDQAQAVYDALADAGLVTRGKAVVR